MCPVDRYLSKLPERPPKCRYSPWSISTHGYNGRFLRPTFLGGIPVPNFVDEVDNDIVFLDTKAVEVLAHSLGQLFLVLPLLLAPQHRRRVDPYASWLGKDRLVKSAREGAREAEVVFAAVGVKRLAVKRGPLKLHRQWS